MRFLVLTTLIATASIAHADEAKPAATKNASAAQMHTDDCARATAQHRACVIDMGQGDDIEGSAATGPGNSITLAEWTRAPSLIHLRRDFITEIIKSAEDL